MAVANPNDWLGAQARFRQAYRNHPADLPRTPVHWRLTPASVMDNRLPPWLPHIAAIAVILARAWRYAIRAAVRRDRMNAQPQLAVWLPTDEAGGKARLIFECEPSPEPLEGDGMLVGELDLNGACCLELEDGSVVWPTYNPRPATFLAPRR